MNVYRTRFGREIDIGAWPKRHQQFLRQAYYWYIRDEPYERFIVRILGASSPVLDRRANGPIPTQTELYDVVTDLQFRLGVRQGLFEQDWEGEVDPPWPPDGRT